MIQSGHVAELISQRTGARVELVGLTTFGDVTRVNLPDIGGTGVFVSALRESLLGGEVDLAVHSLKDLPTAAMPGITLAAVPAGMTRGTRWPAGTGQSSPICRRARRSVPAHRAGPRSCCCCAPMSARSRSVATRAPAWRRSLPGRWTRLCSPTPGWPGSANWTGSARYSSRTKCCPHRDRGRWRWNAVPTTLTWRACWPRWMIRAAGQQSPRSALCSPNSRPGCSAPLGAYAAGTGVLHLTAVVVAEDGGLAVRASQSGAPSRAEDLGRDVAAELLQLGAGTIVAGTAVTSNGDDAQ